jgi:hypothetical protein
VSYAKYGGVLMKDPETDEHFRLLLDKDIVAIVSEGTKTVKEAV